MRSRRLWLSGPMGDQRWVSYLIVLPAALTVLAVCLLMAFGVIR